MRALALFTLLATAACANRVNATEQCLGNGGTTSIFENYTFSVDSGPALDVAGNCHVVLVNCTVTAPEGIHAAENAVVTVRGGILTATRGVAVRASGHAQVTFEGTRVTGEVRTSDAAQVRGAGR